MVSHNTWKYLSVGLLAILAVGFSFPQAFAHVTNSLTHNVTHIMEALGVIDSNVDGIKAKTDNLPSDPASDTSIEAAVTSVGATKSVVIDAPYNPADGETILLGIIDGESSGPGEYEMTFVGHITMNLALFPSENNVIIKCFSPRENNFELGGATGIFELNEDFSCVELRLAIQDISDGIDDSPVHVNAVIQYTESRQIEVVS